MLNIGLLNLFFVQIGRGFAKRHYGNRGVGHIVALKCGVPVRTCCQECCDTEGIQLSQTIDAVTHVIHIESGVFHDGGLNVFQQGIFVNGLNLDF